MAMSTGSSCSQAGTGLLAPSADLPKISTAQQVTCGLIPLPARPALTGGPGLRRKKSLKPVKSGNASGRELAPSAEPTSLEISVSAVGEELATASGEILDAVESVLEAADRRSAGKGGRLAGKANSRTSRRRALVMCLALGMVRPCTASGVQQGHDLRRTVSEAIPKTATATSSASSLETMLVSQVSLATTIKQTNFLGEQEDMQKHFTTVQ